MQWGTRLVGMIGGRKVCLVSCHYPAGMTPARLGARPFSSTSFLLYEMRRSLSCYTPHPFTQEWPPHAAAPSCSSADPSPPRSSPHPHSIEYLGKLFMFLLSYSSIFIILVYITRGRRPWRAIFTSVCNFEILEILRTLPFSKFHLTELYYQTHVVHLSSRKSIWKYTNL